MTKRGVQFIAENKIGTSSTPNHWIDTRHAGDFLTTPIDFEISHTDAGVYVQFQPEEMIDADVELRLKGEYQYITIPINQIQPSVYLANLYHLCNFKTSIRSKQLSKITLKGVYYLSFLIK